MSEVKFEKSLRPIFPSKEISVHGASESDYNDEAAHSFRVKNCVGFNNGQTEYVDSHQDIQFVKKLEDGTVIPGMQSEQLLRILIARTQALNNKFPDRRNSIAITHMEEALLQFQERVSERIDRGVMGQLKK